MPGPFRYHVFLDRILELKTEYSKCIGKSDYFMDIIKNHTILLSIFLGRVDLQMP